MAYVTPESITMRLPQFVLDSLMRDGSTTLDEQIELAQGEVDSYLSGGKAQISCPVPPPVPAVLVGVTLGVLAYRLHERYSVLDPATEAGYANAIRWLHDVSNGKASLATDPPRPTLSTYRPSISSSPRVFRRTNRRW